MTRSLKFALGLAAATLLASHALVFSEPVVVRRPESIVNAPLALRSLDGTLLANGQLMQRPQGDRMTSELTFNFKDSSVQQESTIFTQQGSFRLVSHHLIQKGPAFPQPMDLSIDATSGQVVVRSTEGGQEKTYTEHLELPADLANGILPVILKGLDPGRPLPMVSWLAATPKPRLVKFSFSVLPNTELVSIGGSAVQATHYVVKVEVGGVSGFVAPIVGKQPPDVHVWVIGGDKPAFLKSEGALFYGGPPWRVEVTALSQ